MTTKISRRATAATGAFLVASLGLGAGAAYAVPAPAPRLVQGNVNSCADAGLAGSIILQGTGDASNASGSGDVSADGLTLTVTLNAGVSASGIAVKGGPNSNIYDGPFTGPITIEGMRAPDNPGGQQAQISHWFVCGPAGPRPTPTPRDGVRAGGGGASSDGMIGGMVAIGAALAAAAGLVIARRRREAS